MQLFPNELALANLKGEISEDERGYCSVDEAVEWLKSVFTRKIRKFRQSLRTTELVPAGQYTFTEVVTLQVRRNVSERSNVYRSK